jgi:TDG/mug DNA glycosylase family protein
MSSSVSVASASLSASSSLRTRRRNRVAVEHGHQQLQELMRTLQQHEHDDEHDDVHVHVRVSDDHSTNDTFVTPVKRFKLNTQNDEPINDIDSTTSSSTSSSSVTPATKKKKRKRATSSMKKASSASLERVYCNPPWLPHKPHHMQNPHTLVVGSMTGAVGLRLAQYYAHPQNHFYSIMGSLLGFDHKEMSYDERIDAILSKGVCMWNVLSSCIRSGSLDSAISKPTSNDIESVLKKHPSINTIGLNGKWCYHYFNKNICKEQPYVQQLIQTKKLRVVSLISSSPAAAMKNAAAVKAEQWREALQIPLVNDAMLQSSTATSTMPVLKDVTNKSMKSAVCSQDDISDKKNLQETIVKSTAAHGKSSSSRIYGNAPLVPSNPEHPLPHTLICGSIAAGEGLKSGQYYHSDKNHFWRIIGNLLKTDTTCLSYDDSVNLMLKNGINCWVVLHSCIREGSLDSNIKQPLANDISSLLLKYPSIAIIGCEGTFAYKYFMKTICKEQSYIQQLIDDGKLRVVQLISSSPAAAMKDAITVKSAQWRDALQLS